MTELSMNLPTEIVERAVRDKTSRTIQLMLLIVFLLSPLSGYCSDCVVVTTIPPTIECDEVSDDVTWLTECVRGVLLNNKDIIINQKSGKDNIDPYTKVSSRIIEKCIIVPFK